MSMIQHEFSLSFHAPAFLGNAEQSGQLRTPPFKAQLRQWWRVAYAASKNFKHEVGAMREAEGKLFGHAWLENDRDDKGEKIAARKSEVRLRLGLWSTGKLKSWEGLERAKVNHPDAEKCGHKVGPHAYLAYGPLDGGDGTKFSRKVNAAIQAGKQTIFSLACPDEHTKLIAQALALMDRFGTVGGRSRNGWGSYSLNPVSSESSLPQLLPLPLRPWTEALALDWPHAIGRDSKPLIWQTPAFDDWKDLMRDLAVLKIGLRTQFAFTTGKNAPRTEARHWLSYPVTNHSVQAWGNNFRLPNSLRFKLRPAAEGKLVGVIFHMPCLPPAAFAPDRRAIEAVWRQVHAFLDDPKQSLARISA